MKVKVKYSALVKRGDIGDVVERFMVQDINLKLMLVDFGYMTIWMMERDVEVVEDDHD
ncbi:hypothetical protein [Weissella muntiaci]|uniref:hypothetical protein n=1 Tax=Weissella muntiaci TaxID=2508881 RepID=UPI001651DC9A|nr:hypothetical protein [Weissella muntiaci]